MSFRESRAKLCAAFTICILLVVQVRHPHHGTMVKAVGALQSRE